MVKPKVKIKEIKNKTKITELKKEESSLEEKVEETNDFLSVDSSSNLANPTLTQNSIPRFTRETKEQVREELRNKDKEFSYIATVNAAASTTRSYDPSIKSGSTFFEARSQGERINPTISASPLQEVQGRSLSIRDALTQNSIEPGLRNFNDQNKEYKTERVEKYVAKRRAE